MRVFVLDQLCAHLYVLIVFQVPHFLRVAYMYPDCRNSSYSDRYQVVHRIQRFINSTSDMVAVQARLYITHK